MNFLIVIGILLVGLPDCRAQAAYNSINAMVFRNSGNTLVTGDDKGRVVFWDVEKAKTRFHITSTHGGVHSIDLSEDEKLLAIACWDGIEIWDIDTRKLVTVINEKEVNKVFFTKNRVMPFPHLRDKFILIGWRYGKLWGWDLDSGEKEIEINDFEVRSMHGHDLIDFTKLGDDRALGGVPPLLLFGDSAGWLNVTDSFRVGAYNKEFEIINVIPSVKSASLFAPLEVCMGNADLAAVGHRKGIITLWKFLYFGLGHRDAERHLYVALLNVFTKHTRDITGLAFADDDRVLVSSGKDGYIHFWNVEEHNKPANVDYSMFSLSIRTAVMSHAANPTDEVVKSYFVGEPIRLMAISQDGNVLAVLSGDYQEGFNLYVWNFKSESKPRKLAGNPPER